MFRKLIKHRGDRIDLCLLVLALEWLLAEPFFAAASGDDLSISGLYDEARLIGDSDRGISEERMEEGYGDGSVGARKRESISNTISCLSMWASKIIQALALKRPLTIH